MSGPCQTPSLLALTVVAIVIAVVVGFFVVTSIICSDPTEWC
jgi:Na+/H+ antiporter NhaB